MGYVCKIHEEFVPEGTCRWCPPPEEIQIGYFGNLSVSAPGTGPASFVSAQIQTNGWVIPAPPCPPPDPSRRGDILNAITSLIVKGK